MPTIRLRDVVALSLLMLPATIAGAGTIATVAGGGPDGFPATQAGLSSVVAVAVSPDGDLVLASLWHHRVYRVTADGRIGIVAGNGTFAHAGFALFGGDRGLAVEASMSGPQGVVVDAAGNIFLSDTGNNRLRRIDALTGLITTVAGGQSAGYRGDGGPASKSRLDGPTGLAIDASGALFIADTGNHVVRRVDAVTGVITTVAGDGQEGSTGDGGPATAASLRSPRALALDASGRLFIADEKAGRVRRVDPADGMIGTETVGSAPTGLACTPAGMLYIADRGLGGLFVKDFATGAVSRVASGSIFAVAVDASGQFLFLSEYFAGSFGYLEDSGSIIRRLSLATGTLTTVAGDGSRGLTPDGIGAQGSHMIFPDGVAVAGNGNLLIADAGNNRILEVRVDDGTVRAVAGSGCYGFSGDGGPAVAACVGSPNGIAVAPDGDLLIAQGPFNVVRRVDSATGVIVTVAGTGARGWSGDGGPAAAADLAFPNDVAVDSSGDIYIADWLNRRVRKVDAATGLITTFAGGGESRAEGVPATQAGITPLTVAIGPDGDLFIGGDSLVRRVDAASGRITTVAGGGSRYADGRPATAVPVEPYGLVVDAAGDLFFADRDRRAVVRVDATTGRIATVAGSGGRAFAGDGGDALAASFITPAHLALDAAGGLFVSDWHTHRVRYVAP